MRRKKDVDAEVARLLDMPLDKISLVTSCFLRTLVHEIVDNHDVHVAGFGTFRLREQKNNAVAQLEKGTFRKGGRRGKMIVRVRRKFRVWFKKALRFHKALEDAYGKENTVEKYGVDEGVDQERLEKEAAAGCPECGQKPVRHGKVLACPTHGTEPFEKNR